MTNDINTLKLIACATAHLQVHGAAAARVPIPGTDKLIVIGNEAWIASNVAQPAPVAARLTDEQIEAIQGQVEKDWASLEEVSSLATKAFARAIEAAVLAAHASADNPSTAGAAKPVGSIGDYAQFHTLLGACYEACEELDAATGKEVFDAGDKLTEVQNKLIEYINTWSVRLAAPALNPSEVRDQALEDVMEAAEILDSFIDNVASDGPYGAEATLTFISQAKQCVDGAIRALKSAAIKAADQQGALGEKGGEA